jgi:ribonuclease-3 family protein
MINNSYSAVDLQNISVAALAHVGDAVYDLLIRTELCMNGAPSAALLHKKTTDMVCARAQADTARKVLPRLNEVEAAVFQRGRNTKTHKPPKGADLETYMLATAFEAVLGYLYLTGQTQRIRQLVVKKTSIPEA